MKETTPLGRSCCLPPSISPAKLLFAYPPHLRSSSSSITTCKPSQPGREIGQFNTFTRSRDSITTISSTLPESANRKYADQVCHLISHQPTYPLSRERKTILTRDQSPHPHRQRNRARHRARLQGTSTTHPPNPTPPPPPPVLPLHDRSPRGPTVLTDVCIPDLENKRAGGRKRGHSTSATAPHLWWEADVSTATPQTSKPPTIRIRTLRFVDLI